jgi:hypothetical protein
MTLTDLALPSRNPAWSRDELILALDLYVRFRESTGQGRPEIVGLSSLLNRIAGGSEGDAFRYPNGVYMKLMNFLPLRSILSVTGQDRPDIGGSKCGYLTGLRNDDTTTEKR